MDRVRGNSKGRAGKDATAGIRDLWRNAEVLNKNNKLKGEYVPWESIVVKYDLLDRVPRS